VISSRQQRDRPHRLGAFFATRQHCQSIVCGGSYQGSGADSGDPLFIHNQVIQASD
jgi:hypothetical protein